MVAILMALLFFAPHEDALAQSRVDVVSGVQIKSSIIRMLTQTEGIVCSDQGGGYYFSYVDFTTMQEKQIPVTGFTVRDFEIYNGRYVFFCGNLGGVGAVGWFDINDLIAGTGLYYSCWIMPGNCNIIYLDLHKMEVFDNGYDIHVVAVTQNTVSGYPNRNRGVVDVLFSMGGVPMPTGVSMRYQSGGDDLFEDIAVTENYVVTMGWKWMCMTARE